VQRTCLVLMKGEAIPGGKVADVGIKSVWGFDPDEVMRAQRLFRVEPGEDDSAYSAEEQRCARIPREAGLQIYELRRMFRL
jgi:hypothetical protein